MRLLDLFCGAGGAALIPATLRRLEKSGLPFVLENVPGARSDMSNAFTLHGGMFGLGVARPRLFVSNVLITLPQARPVLDPVGVYGKAHDGRKLFDRADGTTQYAAGSLAEAQAAMGMDWGDWHGVKEAIPPAYTEHIGRQLMAYLEVVA